MNKKIGFVILTWNSEKYIEDCLQSIFGLSKYDLYISLIDNGSKDMTLKTIDELVIPNNITFHIHKYKKNEGTTKARNEGILYLKQFDLDYLCILDSDTKINEEAIEVLIRALNKDETYGLVGPLMHGDNGNIHISARKFPNLTQKLSIVLKDDSSKNTVDEQMLYNDGLYEVEYLQSACWLLKYKVIEKVGLFNEKYFFAPEDAEYCLRVWKSGYKVIYVPKARIYHAWQRISKRKFISKHNLSHICGLVHFCLKYRQDIIDVRRKINHEQ